MIEKTMAEMVADETRKQYEKHKQHVGTHGGNEAAANLVLADAVIVSANKVVEAIDTLSAFYRERSELEKVKAEYEKYKMELAEKEAIGEDRYNLRQQMKGEAVQAEKEKSDANGI